MFILELVENITMTLLSAEKKVRGLAKSYLDLIVNRTPEEMTHCKNKKGWQ